MLALALCVFGHWLVSFELYAGSCEFTFNLTMFLTFIFFVTLHFVIMFPTHHHGCSRLCPANAKRKWRSSLRSYWWVILVYLIKTVERISWMKTNTYFCIFPFIDSSSFLKGANFSGIGLFLWQLQSGIPILLKVWEKTSWPWIK